MALSKMKTWRRAFMAGRVMCPHCIAELRETVYLRPCAAGKCPVCGIVSYKLLQVYTDPFEADWQRLSKSERRLVMVAWLVAYAFAAGTAVIAAKVVLTWLK